jgi:undecaprenyl-diphosphatase
MAYSRFLPYNVAGAFLWSVLLTLLGYFLGASWTVAAGWMGRASAIIAGFALFAVSLVWLWHWAVRHEDTVKALWQRASKQPWMNALWRRLSPLFVYLQRHLSLRGYLGLQLGGGAIVLLAAGWLFGGIVEDVATGDPITQLDLQIAAWLHARAAPFLIDAMEFVSSLHGTVPMSIATLLLAAVWCAERRWYWLANLLLVIPGGMLINVATKYALHRARPSFDGTFSSLAGFSFPSGHTAVSTLFYGLLATFIVATSEHWNRRVWTMLLACAVVTLVAFSRLYLGAHYLSDVLAAMAEGVAWLALCLTGTRAYWERKEEAAHSP